MSLKVIPFNRAEGLLTSPGLSRRANGFLDNEMGRGVEAERLSKAVNAFDALFVNNMLKTMRSTIPKSGLFDEGMGKDIYTSLFDWEISKEMAHGGGLGLGRMLLKDLNPSSHYEGSAGNVRDGPAYRDKTGFKKKD